MIACAHRRGPRLFILSLYCVFVLLFHHFSHITISFRDISVQFRTATFESNICTYHFHDKPQCFEYVYSQCGCKCCSLSFVHYSSMSAEYYEIVIFLFAYIYRSDTLDFYPYHTSIYVAVSHICFLLISTITVIILADSHLSKLFIHSSHQDGSLLAESHMPMFQLLYHCCHCYLMSSNIILSHVLFQHGHIMWHSLTVETAKYNF